MIRTRPVPRAAARLALVLPALAALALGSSPVAAQEEPLTLPDARRAVLAGRVEDALRILEVLEREQPQSSEVALWHGHALRRAGNASAAGRQYLRAVRLDATNAGALIALGDLQADAGSLEGALGYYEEAIAQAPDFPLGYRRAAGIKVRLVLHADAIDYLQNYLALRPNDALALGVLGMEQYLDEDIEAAITTFEHALRIDPDNPQLHFGLGMSLADRADEQVRALAHLRTAIEGDPTNAMALYLVGRIHASRGELEEALEGLLASLAIDDEQPDAHYRIALVHARLGNREAAREHQVRFQAMSRQRDAAEELRRRIDLLKEAAGIAMAAEDLAAVRQAAEEMAQIAPDDIDVLLVAARVAIASSDASGGSRAVSRALQQQPGHWEALYLQGVLLHQTGAPREAVPVLERSVAGNALYAPAYAALGNARMALDDPAGALDAYQAAIMLEPDAAAHYLNLATAYAALGEAELEARALATHQRLRSDR